MISSDSNAIGDDLSQAPLVATRLQYQIGKLINVQASYAQQHYHQHDEITNQNQQTAELFTTELIDIGLDMEFSPFWGTYLNYNYVRNIQGIDKNDQANWTIHFDWHPNRYWALMAGVNELFDSRNDKQLLLLIGTQYNFDRHSKCLSMPNSPKQKSNIQALSNNNGKPYSLNIVSSFKYYYCHYNYQDTVSEWHFLWKL